jgi:hypothetical protein
MSTAQNGGRQKNEGFYNPAIPAILKLIYWRDLF